ncbi:MAG: hypothetical protein RIB59_13330 [Rhodospirillales bacterium]
MALSNDPVFAQTPKTAGIAFGASSNSTQMDPATVAPVTLITAGTDGSLVTSIMVHAEGTVTAEKFVFWLQPGGAGSWYALASAVLAAYTQAATDAQGAVTVIDKTEPNAAIRLAANDKLGVTHHVDQQSMVAAEYIDY